MIFNVLSVTSLFLAAVGALLALAVLGIAARGWSRARLDERAHLLALVIGVLAVTRLIAWPHFYGLLESYVEPLRPRGVMCIYGVVQLNPSLLQTLQWLKPALLWAAGLWLCMLAVDRGTRHGPFTRARLLLALPLAVLALLDSAGEAVFVLADKGGPRITCCTTFLKTPNSLPTTPGMWERLGVDSAGVITGLYVAVHATVMASCVLLSRERAGRRSAVHRLPAMAGTAVLGILNLAVMHATWKQLVAPQVLGLPEHHCVYELLTGTLALGAAGALGVFGNASLLWPAALDWPQRGARDAVAHVQRRIYGYAAAALASELLMVAAHVV